ncbi:E3 ubiquitin/ISG15 ligase TRIM25-like isoform X1, partial [Clarias magur]
MSQLSPLSSSSTTSNESADSSPTFCHESDKSDECGDSRYLSASEHKDKAYSPAASYISMKSNQSMNPPPKFSDEPDVMGINSLAASPAPSIQSMDPSAALSSRSEEANVLPTSMMNEGSPSRTFNNSDQSDLPSTSFQYRDSYISQMMSENLRCPECKDVLKEPVSIPCGHSFCKSCILSYWIKPAQTGFYSCPQCRRWFTTRPALSLNVILANVVQTHQQATQSFTGPENVACDICVESEVRAVKTCLICSASYCEVHVWQHYTVAALQKHVLVEPMKDLERGGVNTLGKTNISAEVMVPKDHMCSMLMNQMKQLEKKVTSMEVKLEDMQGSKPEDQHSRKRCRTQTRPE